MFTPAQIFTVLLTVLGAIAVGIVLEHADTKRCQLKVLEVCSQMSNLDFDACIERSHTFCGAGR